MHTYIIIHIYTEAYINYLIKKDSRCGYQT